MPISQWLSLLSVVVMALAFKCSKIYLENGSIVFILQVIGYMLLAASSWFAGVYAAVLSFAVCAVTLILKMFRLNRPRIMLPFLVLLPVGGLIVNNRGWLGVLPIIAGMGVVYFRPFQRKEHLPLFFFPRDMWDDIRNSGWIELPKMDNALRLYAHAIDVFLDNIVGVILWGVYALLIQDWFVFGWRCLMLLFNLIDFMKRIWPVASAALARAVPDPNRNKRRVLPGQRARSKWII